MAEVTATCTGVSQVVWPFLKVSVKLSGPHGAHGSHVPQPQSFFGQVVVLEGSKNVFG